ncbi:acylphosphatase [Leifsonia poae]|uniref:acylphosphatase n=1 Tax=Leifsonia poae TaxID=110933 RepID=UPI001CBD2DB4|nr:acylphosphatase [Leifsonia poae]
MIRRNAIVEGRVQGVGFRWGAQDAAHRLGVAGFARNLPDGTVEVEVEGEPDRVERMLAWLRHGPPGSQVDRVIVTERPPVGDAGFRIRATE